jgi:hypothetical protein
MYTDLNHPLLITGSPTTYTQISTLPSW